MESKGVARAERVERLGLDAFALLLIVAVWAEAWLRVRGLTWPCENDLFRDLGAAQNLADGGFMADPAFLGERWWYNPLVPALLALTSKLSGTSLHVAYAAAGAHWNVLSPVAFYVMVAVVGGSPDPRDSDAERG